MVHISRAQRALMGVLAAGLLALPAIQGAAAAKKPAKPAKAAKPAASKGDAKLGRTLYTKEGCSGCHKAGDIKGGEMGPDLTGIGGKETAAQITNKIMHPSKASNMPPVTDAKKAANLTAFLVTLK